MNGEEFRAAGHELIDWVADYLENAGRYPVLARVEPGEIRRRLPAEPPEDGEPMERILADFRCPRRLNVHQKGFNRKGLVTADLRKKPAFYIVKKHYKRKK